MTLDEYKEKITDEILYRMSNEVKEHDRDYTPNTITEEFWLIDLKNYLVPGDKNKRPYKVKVSGYSVEISLEGKWPIYLYFRQGRIIIGNYFIQIDCLERAVEDLRFLTTLIPKYADEYATAMANAAMELKKEKMIQEIYEATVIPAVSEVLKGRGLTCTTRRNFRTITLNLHMCKSKVKTFYISYDDFQSELNDIKSYISDHYPMKSEADLAAIEAAT